MVGAEKKRKREGEKKRKSNDSEDIIAREFKQFLDLKNVFCTHLELAADLLPDAIDPQDCLLLAQNIVPLIHRAHEFEEFWVFPLLSKKRLAPTDIASTIDRLRFEHLVDEEFAQDISISLREFVTDRKTANVDALAWMLRGFFEGLRRHVAFERQYILPLVAHSKKRNNL